MSVYKKTDGTFEGSTGIGVVVYIDCLIEFDLMSNEIVRACDEYR